jgi:hypothetical protein
MRRGIAVLALAALLTGAVQAAAQIYAPQTLERSFRLEWNVTRDKKGPAIEGYVYNTASRSAERMRLQIDRLDAAGTVVGSSTVWVLGSVPMGNRAYFRASVPDAAKYRVQVLTFDWNGGGAGSGGGM